MGQRRVSSVAMLSLRWQSIVRQTIASIAAGFNELIGHRQLVWLLVARDLRVRYRHSALGIAWAVLHPLLLMLVFTLVFARTMRSAFIDELRVPYALYVLAGLGPWAFFANGITQSANSLVANRSLVTKVAMPREVFPITCILTSLFDFLIGLVVLSGVAVWYAWGGEPLSGPTMSWLWLLPLIVLLAGFTCGLGLLAAMANLFYRDVRQVITVVLQLAMFVSAVVVPLPGGRWGYWLSCNPVAILVNAIRDCFLLGRSPALGGVWYCVLLCGIGLIVPWMLFRRAARRFAEVI